MGIKQSGAAVGHFSEWPANTSFVKLLRHRSRVREEDGRAAGTWRLGHQDTQLPPEAAGP